VLAGGYRLIDATSDAPSLPADAPRVVVAAVGAVVPEAVAAVQELHAEEIAADLVVVTSAERLASESHAGRLRSVRSGGPDRLDHLDVLLPAPVRRAPIVTVLDGASHTLSFLGSVYGVPVVPLGMDRFGQSGDLAALHDLAGIDSRHIVEAALLALELPTH
jgi:pyruvate dehydrogenase E1 component